MIDGALVHHLIGDQLVLLVQVEHPELLARLIGQDHPHIGQKRAPRRDHRALLRLLAADAQGGLANQFQIKSGGRTDPLDRLQFLEGGAEHGGQAAETGQEVLGERLDLAARQAAGQNQFEKLVVRQRLEADRGPLAQPLAMADLVRLGGPRVGRGPGWVFRGREEGAGQFGHLLRLGHGCPPFVPYGTN